jgi:hypothetical protein
LKNVPWFLRFPRSMGWFFDSAAEAGGFTVHLLGALWAADGSFGQGPTVQAT